MNFRNVLGCLLFASMCLPTGAFAANSVLSGVFDGSEAETAHLQGTCLGSKPLRYRNVGTFTVSMSGTYSISDVFGYLGFGFDISANIYDGPFNVNSPNTNLVTDFGVDIHEQVSLSSGTTYTLVIQQYCADYTLAWFSRRGTWALAFSGPGTVTSGLKVTVPAMTSGSFNANDPIANTDCGNSQYQQIGPIQVSKSGKYYYSDISLYSGVDMCLQVFTAEFDPANPESNRVGNRIDDWGVVELETGKNYYLVVQPLDESATGEFFFVFAPPAPLLISYAMAGSWYLPATAGQGFLLDVFESSKQMFLAWFTYDLQRPANGVQAMIGDPGHRWMTAVGPFEGNTANLDITWSSGMVFDSETPPVENESDGTITVEFDDCYTGTITYDLGASGATGTVPIERIVNDAVPFCESMTEGAGKPGPL